MFPGHFNCLKSFFGFCDCVLYVWLPIQLGVEVYSQDILGFYERVWGEFDFVWSSHKIFHQFKSLTSIDESSPGAFCWVGAGLAWFRSSTALILDVYGFLFWSTHGFLPANLLQMVSSTESAFLFGLTGMKQCSHYLLVFDSFGLGSWSQVIWKSFDLLGTEWLWWLQYLFLLGCLPLPQLHLRLSSSCLVQLLPII